MTPHLLVTVFPASEEQALHWWLFEDGYLVQSGCDSDPMLAAGLKLPGNVDDVRCAAIVPSAMTTVRWHDPVEDATDKQILAAATIAGADDAIAGNPVHVAAALATDGAAATATIDDALLRDGLMRCQELGLDPDVIIPSGWLLQPAEKELVEADFGFDRVLRRPEMIIPDDPALREFLTGSDTPRMLNEAETLAALARAGDSDQLNLRSGTYAKKQRRSMTAPQRKALVWTVAALLIVSLAIPLVQMAKYYWAAGSADDAALEAATAVLGPVENLEMAERQLDNRLVQENRGNGVFSVPTSALFEALQQTPGVTIDRLSYERAGIVAATLSAVRNEDINPVLLAVQNAGYAITATPRTDATGTAKADITVRAP
ncbi:MAG: hypothetical protein AAGE37_05850 [Pseudomonadota bacterium]